ncbi:trans-sialidase, putative, partial [Trypanosoma cruzi]
SFNEGLDEVSHFYFGAYDEQLSSRKIHATVANVFLYNRPLNETEIGALNANKVAISPPERKPMPAAAATSPFVESASDTVATNTQPTVPSPAAAGPKPTEQATLNASSVPSGGASSTPAESESEGPKPAEPNAATSSVRERSADQPASVTSSGAASSEDDGFLTDDAQTVGTEGGAMMQADQPTQFSVGTPDAADAATHNAEGKGQEGFHPQVKEAEAAT